MTWAIINTYIWVGTEDNLGILCASLATLRPLFTKSIRNRSKKPTAGATPNYTFGSGQKPLLNSPGTTRRP